MNERFRFLIVGLYAWLTAVYLGGILLDMVYANYLKGVLGSTESALLFSEISDSLLCVSAFLIITAIGAIAVSWSSQIARNLFFASLLALSFEFLIPIFFSFFGNIHGLSWIRPFPSGIASILAFLGLYKYYRQ